MTASLYSTCIFNSMPFLPFLISMTIILTFFYFFIPVTSIMTFLPFIQSITAPIIHFLPCHDLKFLYFRTGMIVPFIYYSINVIMIFFPSTTSMTYFLHCHDCFAFTTSWLFLPFIFYRIINLFCFDDMNDCSYLLFSIMSWPFCPPWHQ